MFTKIVWASDGSEQADHALEYLTALAQQERATVHVVHVVERLGGTRLGGTPARADEQELKDKVQGQADSLRHQHGIDTKVYMVGSVAGEAPGQIAEIARDHNADLIIVGSRGHSAIAGAILGSVAQRLLHLAPCPVLIVPPGAPSTTVRPSADEKIAAS